MGDEAFRVRVVFEEIGESVSVQHMNLISDSECAEIKGRIDGIKKERDRALESAEKWKKDLGAAVSANVELLAQINILKAQIEINKLDAVARDKHVEEFKENLRKIKTEYDERVVNLQKCLSDAKAQRDESERRCKELDERLTAATRFIGQAYLDGREGRNG